MNSQDSSRVRSSTTRIFQTQFSCPRVNEEDRLLFENSQLKYQLNQLQQQFKIYKLQLSKYDKEHNDCQEKNLRHLHKELESELVSKYKEIESLKKLTAIKKYEELQIECKTFQQETQRLKKQILKLYQLLECKKNGINIFQNYDDLEQKLREIKQELYKQQIENQKLQDENQQQKQKNEKLEVQIKYYERENKKQLYIISQSQIPEQNKYKNRLQIYRDEIEQIKLQSKISDLENQLIEKQNYKEQYIQKLLKIIKDKDDQLSAYEIANPNQVIKEVSQTQQLLLDNKYKNCIENIHSEQSIIEDEPFELPPQLILTKQPSIRKKTHLMEHQKSFQIDMTSIKGLEEQFSDEDKTESEIEFLTESIGCKLPKVNFYDVEQIGQNLKFQFQLQNISLSQIESLFDFEDKETLSVKEVIEILSHQPFTLQDEQEKLLIARYLVEDNNLDYIIFSQNTKTQIPIIKSVFRQLVGRYKLFHQLEIQELTNYFKQQFLKIQFKMIDTLQQLGSKKQLDASNQCDHSDYEATLKFCDITLTQRQMEYLLLINFSINHQLNTIQYKQLLDYFCKNQ